MAPKLEQKYPEALLNKRAAIAESGTFRQRVEYDLVSRPAYAFGLLAAADIARYCGVKAVSAIEFGVAEGDGLLNLCQLAPQVTHETGISFEIIGFDNAAGLPEPQGHRDHPEIWSRGDFTMTNRAKIEAALPSFARLVIGDVAQTLPEVIAGLARECPIGFIAHDMDLYSSTVPCLSVYEVETTKLLPVSIAYFDDTVGDPGRMGTLFRNEWCGQLLAIQEFNSRNSFRKIDGIKRLRHRRPLASETWLDQVYAVHALDHPFRNTPRRPQSLSMGEHVQARSHEWPY
jgi:hypothetical protein